MQKFIVKKAHTHFIVAVATAFKINIKWFDQTDIFVSIEPQLHAMLLNSLQRENPIHSLLFGIPIKYQILIPDSRMYKKLCNLFIYSMTIQ